MRSLLPFAALTLLSAFLLFQVQPVISKFILPWFGGSPGVWTTCMLFFQIVLFLGYAYAHGLMKLPRQKQFLIHGVLLLLAALSLPIDPSPSWKPTGNEDPVGRILMLLLANVALPYFVLSSTSPLVQVWFSRANPGSSPWRLYAVSNVGSLVALLSYPFFFEPRWDVMQQTEYWSIAFIVFAGLSFLALARDKQLANEATTQTVQDSSPPPSWWQRLRWVLLPALASVMLLATTNHVCQDVAVIPFLWVVPLSLYLITFIICFEHERWYRPLLWALPAMILLFVAAGYAAVPDDVLDSQAWLKALTKPLGFDDPSDIFEQYSVQLFICFGAMFLTCMVCHGELTRIKPAAAHLTEFYLLMSAGGALGGLLVSLVAPHVFTSYLEWPVGLMLGFAIAAVVLLRAGWRQPKRWLRIASCSLAGSFLIAGLAFMKDWGFTLEDRLTRVRNFYGAISVEAEWSEENGGNYMRLYHGGIVHGLQLQTDDWKRDPLTYYGRSSGIGRALESLGKRPDAKVGIVGMGTATVASYGEKGQTFRFYDINPDIVAIARKHFTYLTDFESRGGKLEIVMGDARLNLERESPQNFDVLLLDAFSGDSVPVHLLTLDAFQIYQRHMKPGGIIAVHVSNRYLELAPVINKIANAIGMQTSRIIDPSDGDIDFTDYVLVTNNATFLKQHPDDTQGYEKDIPVSLWTDRRYNLFEILDQ